MESILWALWSIKFVVFLAIQAFIAATVVGALIAGLYQLVRRWVHGILDKSESHILASATVQERK
jgi:hypothetical protein